MGLIGLFITICCYIGVICTFPFSLFFCLKVVSEYERAVIFRIGRILSGGARGPGIFFVLPCIDEFRKVDIRTVSFDVPPQEVLTKDSVTVTVDAVVYFRVENATVSITNVENAFDSVTPSAQAFARQHPRAYWLPAFFHPQGKQSYLKNLCPQATGPWGVRVERVEMKDVRLPVQLQRAMAAEAEAHREAKAKFIVAEGEMKSSHALKNAAEVLDGSPSALQLRYLQTLNTISAEKNSTIIFPLPMNLLNRFMNAV
ncbi:predicted protein [Nematostella vectensis]|uniref:Band 7 domain-containing protein n=1 Tax=Nematostella vectensis TaxID=45351 RepID=A7T5Y2_NEMVE|nr:predicted protein [Nematostella vectensis]|eukprot:XP_001620729.1 hypothetical protein NEMVEDRAFT_v1g147236 [Nematostella vectensis]